MAYEYKGKAEREACAARIRDELIHSPPRRSSDERNTLRLRGMLDRCSTCNACPLIVRALAIMAPAVERPEAQVFKLAS